MKFEFAFDELMPSYAELVEAYAELVEAYAELVEAYAELVEAQQLKINSKIAETHRYTLNDKLQLP